MKRIPFKLSKANSNIQTILNNSNDYNYMSSLPSIDNGKLTFSNGEYINNTAFFIDIRNSSKLLKYYQKRVVARYYRAYINLVLMALQDHSSLREINIVGDCVSAIFIGESQKRYFGDPSDVIEALDSVAKINPLLDILNAVFFHKYGKKMDIRAGIGIEKGKALVIKAGLKGSGFDKYVFLGNNVNMASHLCDNANKNGNPLVLVNDEVLSHCVNNIANNKSHETYYDWLKNSYTIPNMGKYHGGNFYQINIHKELEDLQRKYAIK